MAYLIQIRSDTAANWMTVNPILAQAELGYEQDTTKHKIGDGVTTWSALPYATQGIQGVPGDSALPAPYAANISGAYTIDATHPVQVLTVTGDVTISMPAVPAGLTTPLTVTIVQGATAFAVTLPTGTSTPPAKWAQGSPVTSLAANTLNDFYVTGDEVRGWRWYVSGLAMA